MARLSRRQVLATWISCVVGVALTLHGCLRTQTSHLPEPADGFQFCFWNVENFFDDRDDNRPEVDEEYDDWFAQNPALLKQKIAKLCDALLGLNQGRGPDILAMVEVESVRAVELLQAALNQRLADASLHYTHILMKELTAGRHIAPAILTRLPVRGDRTQLHGRQMRVLEGHIVVNGRDLVVIVSHWTSRLTDHTGERRAKYGDQIHGVFHAMARSNPAVDLLVCGDFNDPPEADSVTKHLRATGDRDRVLSAHGEPFLFNLLANKEPAAGFGTLNYQGKWFIFDEVVLSPGLLDNVGWSFVPESTRVINTLHRPEDSRRRPWRFGGAKEKGDRGYSDHFPVTIRLKTDTIPETP